MTNPEDPVLAAIDALERDEIDELVDWQLENGPRPRRTLPPPPTTRPPAADTLALAVAAAAEPRATAETKLRAVIGAMVRRVFGAETRHDTESDRQI